MMVETISVSAAQDKCRQLPDCCALTVEGELTDLHVPVKVYYRSGCHPDRKWTSWLVDPTQLGSAGSAAAEYGFGQMPEQVQLAHPLQEPHQAQGAAPHVEAAGHGQADAHLHGSAPRADAAHGGHRVQAAGHGHEFEMADGGQSHTHGPLSAVHEGAAHGHGDEHHVVTAGRREAAAQLVAHEGAAHGHGGEHHVVTAGHRQDAARLAVHGGAAHEHGDGHHAGTVDHGNAAAHGHTLAAHADAAHSGAAAGHGHGHHGHELKVGISSVDLAVSVMLIGSVTFHTGLFYLVNYHDEDMKRHSWAVISATISIFTAVLVFQGMSGMIKAFANRLLPPRAGLRFVIAIKYLEVFLWFASLHATIRRYAADSVNCVEQDVLFHARFGKHGQGADSAQQLDLDKAHSPEQKASSDKARDAMQKMKCWALIFAHMSAFASISGGSGLQRMPLLMSSSWRTVTFMPVLLNIILMFGLFRASDYVRSYMSKNNFDAACAKWDEVAEEAENEFGGLSLSFLLIQGVIYWSTGVMTHSHDAPHLPMHPGHSERSPWDSLLLMLLGICFGGVAMLMVWYQSHWMQPPAGEREGEGRPVLESFRAYLNRWYFIVQTVCGMSFAWCVLYSLKWELARNLELLRFPMDPHSTVTHTMLALVISFLAFMFIRGLDLIEDMEATGEVADKCARTMIQSQAVLIGFAWEHAFDSGVAAIAHLFEDAGYWAPFVMKLALAVLVAVVMIPAWRLYILKIVIRFEEQHEEAALVPRLAKQGTGDPSPEEVA